MLSWNPDDLEPVFSSLRANSDEHDYFGAQPHRPSPTTQAEVGGCTPLDGIPNEVLSRILEAGYHFEEHPDDEFRRTVSHASSRFRQIALSTPSLWSTYYLTQGNVNQYIPHLPHYLRLSKGHPLNIDLSCFWTSEVTKQLMDILLPHSDRWRRLSVTTPNTDIFSFLIDVPAPCLEFVSVAHFSSQRRLSLDHPVFGGQLPNLAQLVLRNVSLDRVSVPLRSLTKLEIRGHGMWPESAALEEMLGGEDSTLRELILHVKPGSVLQDIDSGRNSRPISLPALRKLTVFTSEWLTDEVASLVRVFAAPNIDTLLIQEGFGDGTFDATEILRYSTSPQPSLVTTHCNIPVACRCLTPDQLGKLRVLEMCKAEWNDTVALSLAFRGMLSLDKLVLTQLDPFSILRDLDLETIQRSSELFTIPSLRALDIDPIRNTQPVEGELADFFRLFSLPSLSSLVLRHLTQVAWERTLECFAGHSKEYPRLSSLTVAAMPALEPSSSCSPTRAFPYLRHLSIIHAPSTIFLCHLAQTSGKGGYEVPWPDLDSLTIYGDTFRSRPLLHRVIECREEAGRPFRSLRLDASFKSNGESWDWIQEKVPGTVEILQESLYFR